MRPPEQMPLTAAYEAVWRKQSDSASVECLLSRRREHARDLQTFYGRCLGRLSTSCPKCLEVACGTAIQSYFLAEIDGVQTVALDLVPAAIRFAIQFASHLPNRPRFLVGDAARLPFADHSFDLVFSCGFLEHFTDPMPFIEEQMRVLTPKGVLVIDVPQKFNPYTFVKRSLIRKGKWEYGWETEYAYGELRTLGHKLGLRVVGRVGYGYNLRRDGGIGLLRYLPRRIAERTHAGPFGPLFSSLASVADQLWAGPEQRWGHLFLVSIAVAFQRRCEAESAGNIGH